MYISPHVNACYSSQILMNLEYSRQILMNLEYSRQILMNLEYSRQIFERFSNINFHENPLFVILRRPLKITTLWDMTTRKLADAYRTEVLHAGI